MVASLSQLGRYGIDNKSAMHMLFWSEQHALHLLKYNRVLRGGLEGEPQSLLKY